MRGRRANVRWLSHRPLVDQRQQPVRALRLMLYTTAMHHNRRRRRRLAHLPLARLHYDLWCLVLLRIEQSPCATLSDLLPIRSLPYPEKTTVMESCPVNFDKIGYIYIFIRINCSFKNKKLKKNNKRKRKTHNVSKNKTCKMHRLPVLWTLWLLDVRYGLAQFRQLNETVLQYSAVKF